VTKDDAIRYLDARVRFVFDRIGNKGTVSWSAQDANSVRKLLPNNVKVPANGNGQHLNVDEFGPYVMGDDRLAEIKRMLNYEHVGHQILPAAGVTVLDLAAAVFDLLADKGEISEDDDY
jgi:hypothetical protein